MAGTTFLTHPVCASPIQQTVDITVISTFTEQRYDLCYDLWPMTLWPQLSVPRSACDSQCIKAGCGATLNLSSVVIDFDLLTCQHPTLRAKTTQEFFW